MVEQAPQLCYMYVVRCLFRQAYQVTEDLWHSGTLLYVIGCKDCDLSTCGSKIDLYVCATAALRHQDVCASVRHCEDLCRSYALRLLLML